MPPRKKVTFKKKAAPKRKRAASSKKSANPRSTRRRTTRATSVSASMPDSFLTNPEVAKIQNYFTAEKRASREIAREKKRVSRLKKFKSALHKGINASASVVGKTALVVAPLAIAAAAAGTMGPEAMMGMGFGEKATKQASAVAALGKAYLPKAMKAVGKQIVKHLKDNTVHMSTAIAEAQGESPPQGFHSNLPGALLTRLRGGEARLRGEDDMSMASLATIRARQEEGVYFGSPFDSVYQDDMMSIDRTLMSIDTMHRSNMSID